MSSQRSPWFALYALVVGSFMILLDMTIVAVANPAIMDDLHADISNVIWVTSAYLLSYAVPLLITGRLGDRFGPKNIYLLGLAVFTASSLWCAMSSSIEILIAARAVQGLGAALMTPQTMAIITRTFPSNRRGAAMGLWGGVSGLATLVGPILGGFLVDSEGWEWIFYINVPIGVIAFALAVWLVPALETHEHKFDLVGMALSAAGMFLLVFGIQEGNSRDWDGLIWALIIAGVVVMGLFMYNQSRNSEEPLVPLSLFKDRNFAMSNIALGAVNAAVTALFVPFYFYLQQVQDMSSTGSALVLAPMAILAGILAPVVGKLSDRMAPRTLPTIGFAVFAATMFGFATLMRPDTPIVLFLVIGGIAGVANACIWAPLATSATTNLPMQLAGAGSGVYYATRQVAAVLGSATVGALLSARIAAQHLPTDSPIGEGMADSAKMSEPLLDKLSTALGEAMYLPAVILLIGLIASALLIGDRSAAESKTLPPEKADIAV
ncbi:MFS transporter [Rhodococcus oxybenzonivorans]|uniref:MFS transporter n=1 Tax=Rhodococcus oxybenzonivorans TaxID=1990687 RepID=A0A2S2C284_9NOCA|nr:DHA2 family efflux MFS transporter permease subunit [Rhodococcus oxybenzonivorans]AWK74980.1 MFS transporter [Rhodococcus oxybenzonivorans]